MKRVSHRIHIALRADLKVHAQTRVAANPKTNGNPKNEKIMNQKQSEMVRVQKKT
jgi:hypothetical protein